MATHRLIRTGKLQCFYLLFFLLAGCAEHSAPTTTFPEGADLRGRVVKVMDGDSLRLRVSGGEVVEVRLHGIDAPEWKQPHGEQAKRALRKMIQGHKVAVDVVTKDAYNRLVAVIYREHRNINVHMVAEGHAWWYRRYTRTDKALEQAEANAKKARKGLWRGNKPIPPWKWRQQYR